MDQVWPLPSDELMLSRLHRYYRPLRLPLRTRLLHGSSPLIRSVSPNPPPCWLTTEVSLLGRRLASPVPTMAIPPFHAPYAAGFFGAASPSSSHLPWPSPMRNRLGSLLAPLGTPLRRGRLRFMLRAGGLHTLLLRARSRVSTPRSPRTPAGCYKGGLVPPSAGLSPASHRELPGHDAHQQPPPMAHHLSNVGEYGKA